MTYDPASDLTGRPLTPDDHEVPQRKVRLRELGLGQGPDPELDAFARELAEAARDLSGTDRTPFVMVNFVTDRQRIGGLYIPQDSGSATELASAVNVREMDLREGPRDFGFCPHVVVRRKALVLDDVCDYPRFAGNAIVDQLGVRTYVGAPLMDDRTGMALGTICIVDNEPRPWGHPGLNFIKDRAEVLMKRIHRRGGLSA